MDMGEKMGYWIWERKWDIGYGIENGILDQEIDNRVNRAKNRAKSALSYDGTVECMEELMGCLV